MPSQRHSVKKADAKKTKTPVVAAKKQEKATTTTTKKPAGRFQAKAPKQPAMDFPIAHVTEGQTPGSLFFVSEVQTRTSAGWEVRKIAKCWKALSFGDRTTEEIAEIKEASNKQEQLEQIAWENVQEARENREDTDEMKATLKTPEEDKAYFAQLASENLPKPSLQASRAKARKVAASRAARGLRSDGKAFQTGMRTVAALVGMGALKRGVEEVSAQVTLAKLEEKNGMEHVSSASELAAQQQQSSSEETPSDYPVYYSAADLHAHGLSINDLTQTGLDVNATVDGGAVLGNLAFLTEEEKAHLFSPASPMAKAMAVC